MFERYTERAREVVMLAQDEARSLKHNYIGTEHLLLGLLREEEGRAARVLNHAGIHVEDVRKFVIKVIGEGDESLTGQSPFTPRARKVCELALREALALGHRYVGTEHLLLGLVRENEGVAARYLNEHGADPDKVRMGVVRQLNPPPPKIAVEITGTPPAARLEVGRWREGLVQVLNNLGDRSGRCPENADGCVGCEADAREAMLFGLHLLGYETWAEFHHNEIHRKATS